MGGGGGGGVGERCYKPEFAQHHKQIQSIHDALVVGTVYKGQRSAAIFIARVHCTADIILLQPVQIYQKIDIFLGI